MGSCDFYLKMNVIENFSNVLDLVCKPDHLPALNLSITISILNDSFRWISLNI